MVVINDINEKYFELDGVRYAKIYQPLKVGSDSMALYNVYDSRLQILPPTNFSSITLNGQTYDNLIDLIQDSVQLTFAEKLSSEADILLSEKIDRGGYSGTAQDLKNELDSKAFDGVTSYETLSELQSVSPVPVDGTTAFVAKDPTSENNGRYFVKNGAWEKFSSVVSSDVSLSNTSEAVSGASVFDHVQKNKSETLNFFTSGNQLQEIEFSIAPGYARKSDGVVVVSGTWQNSGFIKVQGNEIIRRDGIAYSSISGGSTAICFYDENKVFLSAYIGEADQVQDFDLSEIENVGYIIVNSTESWPLSVYIRRFVSASMVEGLSLANISNAYNKKTGLSLLNGFIDSSGDFNSAASWRCTDFESVIEGAKVFYTGETVTGQPQVVGYDSDKNFISVLLDYSSGQKNAIEVVIPEGVKYVRFSSIAAASSILFEKDAYLWDLEGSKTIDSLYFIPKKAWGRSGEVFRMSSDGIFCKHPERSNFDVVWSVDDSHERALRYVPGVETSKNIELMSRTSNNELVVLGETELKVSGTPISPSSAHYFLHLGDSTVQGVSSASIEGAIINEVSRLLTGTGTPLLTGAQNPAPLSLSNLNFIGTLGDQPIKHEGRGGWGFNDYLNTSAGNAFYNPSTSGFDIDYYLSNNGFGGVSASGDNLTIFIQLGWNHVYSHALEQVDLWVREMIDSILSDRPSARICLLGMASPPLINKKHFTGSRAVSYESIMIESVYNYSNLYQTISEDPSYSSNVEFIPIAPFYFAADSYPNETEVLSRRHSETRKVYTDHVHPNARGYAQFADVLFNYILFNYCQ